MKIKLLLLAALAFASSVLFATSENFTKLRFHVANELSPFLHHLNVSFKTAASYYEINHTKNVLKTANLNPTLTQAVLNMLACVDLYGIQFNPILTVVDYSLPSNEKRLWVFDLHNKKILFHTYVSHGIKSGRLVSNYFSNRYNSRASSLGIYRTEKTYYGREGLSLKLTGLDNGFNDHALNRAIVIHAGWYMDENFIKKYGRAGRSWGCPALPHELATTIINTIKENSLFLVYFPSEEWLTTSKFLNCPIPTESKNQFQATLEQCPTLLLAPEEESREKLFYADVNKGNKYLDSKPILVMSAPDYHRIYQAVAPLNRMLRRQVENTEYIALSHNELKQLIDNSGTSLTSKGNSLDALSFVVPASKMRRGYYRTEMHVVPLGKIQEIKEISPATTTAVAANLLEEQFLVYFQEKPPIYLNSTKQFIRWIGL